MILPVPFLMATVPMMLCGRVGPWDRPIVAPPRISVVWPVAPVGAAPGVSLPGERSGDDGDDDLAGDLVRDIDESGGRSED